MVKGIDISSYQANLNFNLAKNAGNEICIIKATEGNNYISPSMHDQANKALNVGMKIGFYHFFTNKTVNEADNFINTIKGYKDKCQIKPVIDIESQYTDVNIINFINKVEKELNTEMVIYCNLDYARKLSNNNYISNKPLWLAYYGNNDGSYHKSNSMGNFKTLAGEQYSDKNSIGNIKVDFNYFYEPILSGNNITNNITNNSDSSNFSYIIKSGDTLSGIAAKYNTTTNTLAAINNITNVNKIYAGQKILIPYSNSTVYTIKSGDTLSGIAAKYNTTYNQLAKINNISDPNKIYPGQVLKIR